MTISENMVIAVIGWVLLSWSLLISGIIGLLTWQSKRELSNNDAHKKEMERQQEKYLQLHIEVINGRIEALSNVVDKNEAKSEEADKELKHVQGLSRLNERELYQRDEQREKDVNIQVAALQQELTALAARIQNRRVSDS
jgi:hypothetical protein